MLNGYRNELQHHLAASGIPSIIYYPLPLHKQEAFVSVVRRAASLSNAEQLCREVLSIPMHTELTLEVQQSITEKINTFYIHK